MQESNQNNLQSQTSPEETQSENNIEEIKQHIEVILFLSSEPVNLKTIANILEIKDVLLIKKAIELLKEEINNSNRVFEIVEIANGYQFLTKPQYSKIVEKLTNKEQKVFLTPALMETLSIIAYKQPITRAQIEDIRGVNSSDALRKLIELEFIKVVGRSEKIGSAPLYGTTEKFLQYFGLKSIKELPPLENF